MNSELNQEKSPPPKSIKDEPLIRRLLDGFINQIERDVKPYIKVSEQKIPELYQFDTLDTSYLWELITDLETDHAVINITLARSTPGNEPYEGAKIFFNHQKEALIRNWLSRPRKDRYSVSWQKTLLELSENVGHISESLAVPIRVPGKSPSDIIQGFLSVRHELGAPTPIRTLSARCFWGDSKFLENHEQKLFTLYPEASKNVITRPILINVFIPDEFNSVIFVENQDSFLMLAEHLKHSSPGTQDTLIHHALVYSAGFRAADPRARTESGVVFSQYGKINHNSCQKFENWWVSSENDNHLKQYFWGDLDFTGFSILESLKNAFPRIDAWQPGYKAMVAHFNKGVCHHPTTARKDKQIDPGTCGCSYSDEVLLPLIRERNAFLDQEVVSTNELL